MNSFPIVILGGGGVAGYAAKEFVAQSGKKGELAIVTAENALPDAGDTAVYSSTLASKSDTASFSTA